MSDSNAKIKEPSDGSSNWIEYRRMILSTLERIEHRLDALDAKVDDNRLYIAGQKGATAVLAAVVSLVFGVIGALLTHLFKKGS